MSSINWKATARTGSLKVNTHDYTASPQVCILLDFDSDTQWKNVSLCEEQIRIAATMSRLFMSQGVPVSMISNGRDFATDQRLVINSGCGDNHIQMIKESLARLDIDKEMLSFEGELEGLDNTGNCQYLLISSACSDSLQRKYKSISDRCEGSGWIVCYRSIESAPTLDYYKGSVCWEVSQ